MYILVISLNFIYEYFDTTFFSPCMEIFLSLATPHLISNAFLKSLLFQNLLMFHDFKTLLLYFIILLLCYYIQNRRVWRGVMGVQSDQASSELLKKEK